MAAVLRRARTDRTWPPGDDVARYHVTRATPGAGKSTIARVARVAARGEIASRPRSRDEAQASAAAVDRVCIFGHARESDHDPNALPRTFSRGLSHRRSSMKSSVSMVAYLALALAACSSSSSSPAPAGSGGSTSGGPTGAGGGGIAGVTTITCNRPADMTRSRA